MRVRKPEQLLRFIRHHRRSMGIEADAVAASADVSLKFVSQLENGKVTIEVDALRRVTRALALSIPVLDDPDETGRTIRERRKQLGMDQVTAAALCNVSPRFLSTIENGRPKKRLNKLFDVLHGFGIEVEIQV